MDAVASREVGVLPSLKIRKARTMEWLMAEISVPRWAVVLMSIVIAINAIDQAVAVSRRIRNTNT